MPHHITKDNQSIFYQIAGSGPTVIFIHGWASSSQVWESQIPFFSSHFRVLTIDLRGHGASSECAGSFSIAGFVSDLRGLVGSLCRENPFLVGWSMGSMVALEYAHTFRDSLAGIVLVGTTPCFLKKNDFDYGVPSTVLKRLRVNLKRDYVGQIFQYCGGLFYKDKYLDKQQEGIIKDLLFGPTFPPPEKVALETLTALEEWDVRTWLDTITCPVSIVHGDADGVTDVRAALALKEQIQGATVNVMNGVGHAPFLTVSHQFNNTVSRFLKDCSFS